MHPSERKVKDHRIKLGKTYMVKIPNLINDSTSSIRAIRSSSSGIVLWPRAPNIGDGTVLGGKGILDVGESVGGAVTGGNAGGGEPGPGGEAAVECYCCFVELGDG